MSIVAGANIVQSGLVFFIDAANQKSYSYQENLFTYSQDFSQPRWQIANGTISTSTTTTVAPDGTFSATAFFETTATNAHYIDLSGGISLNTGSTYTRSVYLKTLGRQWVAMNFFDGTTLLTYFDIVNGVVGNSATGNNPVITSVGNGWYRCSLTRTITSSTNNYFGIETAQSNGVDFFAGSTTTGYYIWGSQLQYGAYVGAYTTTTSAAITATQSWYNLSTSTATVVVKQSVSTSSSTVYSLSNGGYFDFVYNNVQNTVGSSGTFGFTLASNPVPPVGSFTISAWINRNSTFVPLGDREAVFSCATGADGFRFGYDAGGRPYYLIGGVGGVNYQEGALGTTVMTDGVWHLLTIVYDRSAQLGSYAVYGYIDTTLSGSVTITAASTGNVAWSSYNIPAVGNGGCCRAFGGKISSIKVYNRALTASEVQQNFNANRGRYGV